MFKFSKRNTRKSCEICSKLTINTPERRHWRRSGVFTVNFEHTSHHFLVFLLLTFSKKTLAGCSLFILSKYQIKWKQNTGLWWVTLTLSWRRSLSSRNQSIGLLCKSMDWFPYDNDHHHQRVKHLLVRENLIDRFFTGTSKDSVLNVWKYCKHEKNLVFMQWWIIFLN